MPPKKKKNPYWKGIESDIESNMGQGVETYIKGQEAKIKASEKVARKVSEVSKKQLKEQARQSKEYVEEVSEHVQKESDTIYRAQETWIKRLGQGLERSYQLTKQHAQKLLHVSQDMDRKMPKGRGNIGGGIGFGGIKEVGGVVGGAAVGELKEIAGYLKGMVPAIAAIGGPALFLIGIFNRIFDIQKDSADLMKASGGNLMGVTQFNLALGQLSNQVRIDQDDLRDLAKEFLNAGVPMSDLNGKMLEYIEASSGAIRMFGLSHDEAAKYTRTLAMQGMGMASIKSHWNDITQEMFSFNGTIQDANASVVDGIGAWEQYGATLGSNITDFQKGIMETRGLFKSLNMDAKLASSSMSKIHGDLYKRRRHAAIVANITGQDKDTVFNMMSDPSKSASAMGLRMTGGIKLMQKLMGSDANYLQQDMHSITDQKAQSKVIMKYDQALRYLGQSDFDPEMMNGVLSQFRNYKGSVDNFLPDMKKLQGANSPKRTMEETLASLADTMPELIKKIQRSLENLTSQMANEIIPRLPTIIKSIDNAVTQMELLTPVLGRIAGLAANAINFLIGESSAPVSQGLGYLSQGGVTMDPSKQIDKRRFMGIPLGVMGAGLDNIGRWGGDAWNAATGQGGAATGGPSGYDGSGLLKFRNISGGARIGPAASFTGGAHGKSDWGPFATPAFKKKVVEVAARLGMNPDHLMAVMSFESNLNPAARNTSSDASGLIQIMNAAGVGSTKPALRAMSGVQQLDYVEKYLSNYKGKMKTMQDAYMAVFSPKYLGASADTIMYSKGSREYAQNPLDGGVSKSGKDGHITVGEAASFPAAKLATYKSLASDPAVRDQIATLLREQNEHLKNIAINTKDQKQIAMGQAESARLGVKGNIVSSQNMNAAKAGVN